MLSRESARKVLPSIRRITAASPQLDSCPLSSQSLASDLSSSSSSSRSHFGSVVSRFLAIGSGFGAFCYSSISRDECLNPAFAECSNETALEASGDGDGDRFRPLDLEEKESPFIVGDAYRRKVFFKYEQRIRTQSPPVKVFEYFASVRTPAGHVFMTPDDLMRAIVPVFPSSESDRVREGSLRGERPPLAKLSSAAPSFFTLFDTNGDGLLSFPEYIFLVTILSIPESSFSVAFKMFDLDNNGEIDREEFNKVMALMRKQNRQGALYNDDQHGGKKVDSGESVGLIDYLFGGDGKACLKHERFVQFLRELRNEILRLEFSHYDHKSRGAISARDFALSLVASADVNDINRLLQRVDDIPSEARLTGVRVTFEEFKAFAELREKLEPFSLAIFSYGKVNGELTKTDFQRAASQVCGVTVAEGVVDIIFQVFDRNGDGSLSTKEFVSVVQRRQCQVPQGYRGVLSCWLDCAANCSSPKLRF